ncbi:ankyrin repeat domain-containing protein [Aspergillus tubingensis]|uniref:ankyrin repeat domain-containing protein n=1 Tax=Aspergillus tubingensis TaxID=5068 RepID=UPI0015791FAC|nr:ankyrin [Aspergillus tubingensis]GFN13710.1 ankyrin [Aspergillus tubingensis]
MAPGAAFTEEFFTACMEGNLAKVRKALASGLPTRTLEEGLSLATAAAHPDVEAALFDAGAPMTGFAINSLGGKDGEQHPDVVRHYLDRGLNPNRTTSNREPLLRFLNAATARELLLRGADSNRRGPKKVAPLASALEIACEDDTSLFDLLVEYGAKIEPSLFFDVIRPRVVDGQFKTKFLLSKDLDPTTTSPEWATPLHCAAYFAKEEVVKILLDTGADNLQASFETILGLLQNNQR